MQVTSTGITTAIHCAGTSNSLIYNNLIYGGSGGGTTSAGLQNMVSATCTLRNNTIVIGTGSTENFGINNVGSGAATAQNKLDSWLWCYNRYMYQ